MVYYAPTEDDDGVLVGFTIDWLRYIAEVKGMDHRQILVAMSDGSLSSDIYGGCWYFAVLLSFAIDNEANADPPNGVINYISLSAAVSRRTSIEFCELKGVELMLRSIVEFASKIRSTGTPFEIRVLSASVDNKSVLAWIGGALIGYGHDVAVIISVIYGSLRITEFRHYSRFVVDHVR